MVGRAAMKYRRPVQKLILPFLLYPPFKESAGFLGPGNASVIHTWPIGYERQSEKPCLLILSDEGGSLSSVLTCPTYTVEMQRSISLHGRRIIIKLQPFSHGLPQELRMDLILEASRGVEAE